MKKFFISFVVSLSMVSGANAAPKAASKSPKCSDAKNVKILKEYVKAKVQECEEDDSEYCSDMRMLEHAQNTIKTIALSPNETILVCMIEEPYAGGGEGEGYEYKDFLYFIQFGSVIQLFIGYHWGSELYL